MDVIILSKTKMRSNVCVGAISGSGRYLRLLTSNGENQPVDTKFNVCDVYTIECEEVGHTRPPHIEDVKVNSATKKFTFSMANMVSYLRDELKIKIWKGSPNNLFDGKLLWTDSGSGYISASHEIPENSVGFWITEHDLTRRDYKDKIRYSHPPIQNSTFIEGLGDVLGQREWRNFTYVGSDEALNIIPKNTIIRVSLARWWGEYSDDERCYLQLSGWYL